MFKILFLFFCFAKLSAKDDDKKEKNAAEFSKQYWFDKAQDEKVSDEEKIEYLETFESLCPDDEKYSDSVYQRGCLHYKQGEYAKAAAIFDLFLTMFEDHPNRIDAIKILFYCYYDQISIACNLDLVKMSYKFSKDILSNGIDDEKIKDAHFKLWEYLSYYNMARAYVALDSKPMLWVQYLWSCVEEISEYKNSSCAQEAYCRLIEFFVEQGNVFYEDAKKIYVIMKKQYKNSKWTKLAADIFSKKDIAIDITE